MDFDLNLILESWSGGLLLTRKYFTRENYDMWNYEKSVIEY